LTGFTTSSRTAPTSIGNHLPSAIVQMTATNEAAWHRPS